MKILLVRCCVTLALLLGAGGALAHDDDQTLPPNFEVVTLPHVVNLGVNFTFTPDGTIFLARKRGLILVVRADGTLQGPPLLDLADEVNATGGRGLLGIEVHPGFVPDGGATAWVYLVYTVSPVPGEDLLWNEDDKFQWGRLTRYQVVTNGPDIVVDPSTRQVLLGNRMPDGSVPDAIANVHGSHSNGTLAFADDGTLLLSTGDGAHFDLNDYGGNDAPAFDNWTHPDTGLLGPIPAVQDSGAFRAQDVRSLSGKVLRLDPATGLGLPSNPFWDGDAASNASRIWALGLRNAYHMTLLPGTGAADPAAGQPNDMIIGDVGWHTWEEINVSAVGGENFGWPCYEGMPTLDAYQSFDPPAPAFPNCHSAMSGVYTPPAVVWNHSDPTGLSPAAAHLDASGAPGAGFVGNCALGGVQYTGGGYPPHYVGRVFIADYGEGWLKTLELDGNLNVVAVQDFAEDLGGITDLERHPITGNIWWVDVDTNQLHELRFADNLTPIALASASPSLGNAPLDVSFTGSDSYDPESGPLVFSWDFGDGSPGSIAADPLHTYVADGHYVATMTVTDNIGNEAFATVDIDVGAHPPVVEILSPTQGQQYTTPELITLDGTATDPDGLPMQIGWTVDLFHNEHVHPDDYFSPDLLSAFTANIHGLPGDLHFYRVELAATDSENLTVTDQVYIYSAEDVVDVSGTERIIRRLDELSPPISLGTGNVDPEVLRDGQFPDTSDTDPLLQHDTYHAGDQGADDWVGYELTSPPDDSLHFVSLLFQEGLHHFSGGWWKDFAVEVRDQGTWQEVGGLVVEPDYPFDLADQPFFDGVPFETYTLRFDPTPGDAIRLRGEPGGSAGFITCAELRARVIDKRPLPVFRDITADGTVITSIDGLLPAGPQGVGNPDPETIRNGTWPPAGSASQLAQFDTFHFGDQGAWDWVGYDFGWPRALKRLVFQEGLHHGAGAPTGSGGAFTTLDVEVQTAPGGPWTSVSGLVVTPPYPGGTDGTSYETYTLDFHRVSAYAVRIAGPPAGTGGFVSVGELRVFEPALPFGCGWRPYGQSAGGNNTLSLFSPSVPAMGFHTLIVAEGAAPQAAGLMALSLGEAALPFKGGTLLLDPGAITSVPIGYDDNGRHVVAFKMPTDPTLEGAALYLQALAFGPPWALSNGLELVLCHLP